MKLLLLLAAVCLASLPAVMVEASASTHVVGKDKSLAPCILAYLAPFCHRISDGEGKSLTLCCAHSKVLRGFCPSRNLARVHVSHHLGLCALEEEERRSFTVPLL
jgi:hypothetical protein